jgi:hypothetical protein
MVVLFASTIISCSDALNLIHRLTKVVGLSEVQRTEIVQEIRKVIPSCPVKIVKK